MSKRWYDSYVETESGKQHPGPGAELGSGVLGPREQSSCLCEARLFCGSSPSDLQGYNSQQRSVVEDPPTHHCSPGPTPQRLSSGPCKAPRSCSAAAFPNLIRPRAAEQQSFAVSGVLCIGREGTGPAPEPGSFPVLLSTPGK